MLGDKERQSKMSMAGDVSEIGTMNIMEEDMLDIDSDVIENDPDGADVVVNAILNNKRANVKSMGMIFEARKLSPDQRKTMQFESPDKKNYFTSIKPKNVRSPTLTKKELR